MDLILFVFIINVYVGMYLCDACVDVCTLLHIWRQATTLWSCFSPLCGSWNGIHIPGFAWQNLLPNEPFGCLGGGVWTVIGSSFCMD